MKRIVEIIVDLQNRIYNTIFLKQMDTTIIKVKILNNNTIVNLTSQTVGILFTKPNGIIVQQLASDIDIQNGIATIPLLEDCLLQSGKGKIEIEVRNTYSEVISSFNIPVQIERTGKSSVTPENTFNYIESMERAVNTLQQQGTEMLTEYQNLIAAVEAVLGNVTNRGHIYGIKRKITDLNNNINTSPNWTKIFDNEGLVAQAQIGTNTNVRNDYDNIYPWSKIETINYDTNTNKVTAYYGDENFAFDGSNGEVLTRVPKMWIKRLFPVQEDDGFYEYRMIADFEVQDFIEIKPFEAGRYKMSVDSNNIGHSISGQYPKYNANIVNFKQYANNLGTNYCLVDWRRFVLETLYLVEYANNNSQACIGNGIQSYSKGTALKAENNVNRIIISSVGNGLWVGKTICIGTSADWNSGVAANRDITAIEEYSNNGIVGYAVYFSGNPVNIALGNVIWGSAQKTGECDQLGMKSGCLNNNGYHSVIYRGFENIFADIFEFIDGINIKDYQSYICYDPTKYAPDTFNEDYEILGYVNPHEAEGYTKVMGFDKKNPLIALPKELGAGSSNGYCDYCYSKNAGNRVARVGGPFSAGAGCGFFFWYFSSASSDSNWHIGARLLKYQ